MSVYELGHERIFTTVPLPHLRDDLLSVAGPVYSRTCLRRDAALVLGIDSRVYLVGALLFELFGLDT